MMEAEAAALSQLQLQVFSLVSDLRLLRERERATREELHSSIQRWKEAEEEHRREARELRAEVAARDDEIRRLESRIKCLENENDLLEKNEKKLNESLEGLLQSREAFIKHYEDSACSLQWSNQMKDKQIAVISEKLNSHLVLFSSVGKEVAAVKQVLGNVECLVGEKENVVSDLRGKVQRISVLEKDFAEKLGFLEGKICSYQVELRNRARIIYGLKENLEAEKLNNKFQPQLEELRNTLLVKDETIERLTSEKQAMHIELHNMEIALHKFQDIFGSIGHEVTKSSSPISESQDIQEIINNKKLESIPGSPGEPPKHTMVPVIEEAVLSTAITPNVECQLEANSDSKQVQSLASPKQSTLPAQEPIIADTVDFLHESMDIDMGSHPPPAQRTDSVNPETTSAMSYD